MGFNIAGLVINQNYEKDIKKLSADLKWGIELVNEITFEEASSNWTPDDEFRLYFSDKATMIFFAHEWVANQYHSQLADTLNYAYSETVMAFQVDLFIKGKRVRSIMEHEGDRKMQSGQPLELENEHPTADGLTFALIDQLLGETFGGIDFAAKSFRCRKTEYKETDQSEMDKKKRALEVLAQSPGMRAMLRDELLKKNSGSTNTPTRPEESKKWWQFWK